MPFSSITFLFLRYTYILFIQYTVWCRWHVTEYFYSNTFLGKYLFIDAYESKPGQTASIVSKTIDATRGSECNFTFWYNMNGKDMGSLSVSTGVKYGILKNNIITVKGDNGPAWTKVVNTLKSAQDFQVNIFYSLFGHK